MTTQEYKQKVQELASLACTLRAKLEEFSDECHDEWCNIELFSREEVEWYERYNKLLELSANAGEIEEELDKEANNGEED